MNSGAELAEVYRRRFEPSREYRAEVWEVLIDHYFSRCIPSDATVLDLGCGYGEFINNIRCGKKFAIDLNPDSAGALDPQVAFLQQDCATRWNLPDDCLDVVFTSNFFEHLPTKEALAQTLTQAHRCLRVGGKLIAMGPNIHVIPHKYWDFWDHFLPLSHLSLAEALRLSHFQPREILARFLPFTLVDVPRYPLFFLKLYLRMPIAFRLFGEQFLVTASK